MAFAVVFPFLQMDNLFDICHDAHQNPGTCGASRRMLAYGVLHSLFSEFCSFPLDGMDPECFRIYVAQCESQVEIAMSQLDIFMPATYENIMALLLGAASAIEMCKPSTCSVLITTAAGLCQNLGYHRYQTMKDDPEEEQNRKIHIFWMIYMFDKTMSLRMGRASVIQDWDISLPYVTDKIDATLGRDGTAMLSYWIKVARVQGQTYERLFSPAAFLSSQEERTRVAADLVNTMNTAWFERGDASATDLPLAGHSLNRHLQPEGPGNSSPNETELPSRRKRKQHGRALFGPNMDFSGQRQSKTR